MHLFSQNDFLLPYFSKNGSIEEDNLTLMWQVILIKIGIKGSLNQLEENLTKLWCIMFPTIDNITQSQMKLFSCNGLKLPISFKRQKLLNFFNNSLVDSNKM